MNDVPPATIGRYTYGRCAASATSLLVSPSAVRYAGWNGISDIANFPLLALTAGAVSLCMLPLVNGFSRQLERAADLFAIDVTGDSLAFVSSMEKLADLNLANKSPNRIMEFIFYSHPSIENRIKLAADHVGQNV